MQIQTPPVETELVYLNEKIPVDKQLQILVDALKDAYKELIDSALKISGVLLIVVGWFASKPNPLPMLCTNFPLTTIALIFTALGPIGLLYLFGLLYSRAERVRFDLSKMGFDPIFYERFRITKPMVAWALFGQFTMIVGIFGAIYATYVSDCIKTCHKSLCSGFFGL